MTNKNNLNTQPKTAPDKNPAKKKPRPVDIDWFLDRKRIDAWDAFIYSLPKEGKEHDGWSLRENNAVVADGATPLSEDWGGDLYHWANTLSAFFAENGRDMDSPLPQVWEDSINFVNTIFPPQGFKRTMGASHVRFNNHMIETLTVGDTKIILRKVDGNFIELFDSRLIKWEQKADALIDDGLLTGPMAAWHNRMKANQIGGYAIVSDDPKVGLEAYPYSIEEYKVDTIIICSDGLWRLFEGNPELMFKKTSPMNPEGMQERLNKISSVADDLTFIRLDKR
jgi:hypothetical protein